MLNSNASLVQEIISSGLAAPGDWEAILAILIASGQISNSILTQPFGVFGGGLSLTGIVYQGGSVNMQLNSSDVRAIDQMQLRVLDREESTIKTGERYPIETSSFSSLRIGAAEHSWIVDCGAVEHAAGPGNNTGTAAGGGDGDDSPGAVSGHRTDAQSNAEYRGHEPSLAEVRPDAFVAGRVIAERPAAAE